MKIFTLIIPALFQVILRAQESDIPKPDIPELETSEPLTAEASAAAEDVKPGKVSMWVVIQWASLWEPEATLEDVPMEERREWISDTLEEVMIDMKHKHATPQMMAYTPLNYDENRVLVEFPGLVGYNQE